jgi:hypothetical protein
MVAFSGTLVLGVLICVIFSKVSALGEVPTHQTAALDGRQEKLLSERGDMSKWLLGLAYGTLAGVLGMQAKGDEKYRPSGSVGAMVACGLLVVSLFAAFLFQEATAWALMYDSNLFYGSYIEAPLQLQFFTLVIALILLAIWFFRSRSASIISLICLSLVVQLQAAPQAELGCAEKWSKSRHITLSVAGQASLAQLIRNIRTQSGVQEKSSDTCEYTFALADEMRTLVRQRPGESDADFESEVKKLAEQSAQAGALPPDWVARLINISMFWKPVPYATLTIESDPGGLQVRLGPDIAGWTPLQERISPGNYKLELVQDGEVKCSLKLDVKNGAVKSIQYSDGGCK